MFIGKHNKSSGFTLLEMLIAIAIFSVLSLTANTVLQTVLKNDEATQEFAQRLKEVQHGFGVIQRDLNQIVARSHRLLEGGRDESVFQYGPNILDSETDGLAFFRLGWLNPNGMLPRGSIQSVFYIVQEGRLERWYYPYPEPELGSEPIKTVIMDNVLDVKYAFFNEKWEETTSTTQLPKAIAIEIEIENKGKIQRKFLLANGGNSSGNDDNNDNSGSSGSSGSSGGGTATATAAIMVMLMERSSVVYNQMISESHEYA